MAKIIAIAINKGGVGKTVTAKNLASALALQNKKTLLIDIDQQGNSTQGLGYDTDSLKATVNDVFSGDSTAQDAIITTHIENLYLLPAHRNLKNTEAGMTLQATNPVNENPILALKSIVSSIEEYFDYIVIDTPPAISYMTYNALACANVVIIPAAAAAYSEYGISEMYGACQAIKKGFNQNLEHIKILITRVKHTNAALGVLESIKEQYENAILPAYIPESTVVDEAEQLGQPVVMYDKSSKASEQFNILAKAVQK